MKHTFSVAALLMLGSLPVLAQQQDIDGLKEELERQQEAIAELTEQVEELGAVVEEEAQAAQDAVTSLQEDFFRRVNITGYLNTRFFGNGSEEGKAGFQVSPLALITSTEIGRFNFFAEVNFSHISQHAEIVQRPGGEGEAGHAEGEGEAGHTEGDVSGEGTVAVRNAWVEYDHSRELNVRVGKFLSPQYWWQNRYPNVVYTTDIPLHLRELFPPELVGAMVSGVVARPAGDSELGVGYKLYVSNTESEQAFRGDIIDEKSWGGRAELHLPAMGRLRLLNVAADIYRGRTALEGGTGVVENHVWGVEGQMELDRFSLRTEYAQGRWLDNTRFGYYVQPAVRLADDWLAYYQLEGLESPRVQAAELRHLAGVNFKPFPEVAIKAEYYRTVPLDRSFIEHEEGRDAFNGFAAALALFF